MLVLLFGSLKMNTLYSIEKDGERIKTSVAFSNEEKQVLADKNEMPVTDKQAVCSLKTFNSE